MQGNLNTLASYIEQTIAQAEEDLDKLDETVDEYATAIVKEQLRELETAVERIPSLEPPPQTTLQLQSQADVEGAWQNYLRYFLDPSASHGLKADALIQFFRGFNRATNNDLPIRFSDDVVVEAEVSSPNDNRPDIVIHDPGEFFVCCELKLYSSEGSNQTERYVQDEYIGTTRKSQFPESNHYYVYIRRLNHSTAQADEFVSISWRHVREWLKPLLVDSKGRYPARTTAQLADFLDTIQRDMTQDEHIKTAQEKMRLYFDHEDAIREAEAGLQTVYEYEEQNWRRRFIENYLPNNWDEEWHTNPNKYGQIYHSSWRQDDGLAIDGANIRMHLVHLIRNKKSFEEGKLTMQLRWPDDSRYRERFKELFMSEEFAGELDPLLGKFDIDKAPDIDRSNPRLTGKVYSVVKSDLPESYYETLQQAAEEHIEITSVINEMLETAIQQVEAGL